MAKLNSKEHKEHLRKIAASGGRAKRGISAKKTILLEQAHAEVKQQIAGIAKQLTFAATIEAFGSYSIIRKDEMYNKKTKKTTIKWTQVVDDDEILDVMNELGDIDSRGVVGDKYYIITKDKPNYKAVESLLNRSFGRPKESLELSGQDGAPILIKFSE